MTDEIERLRRKAAELVERAARRDTPLSPAEDVEIVDLLKRAMELVAAQIRGLGRRDQALEQLVVRLSLEGGVTSVSWALTAQVLE